MKKTTTTWIGRYLNAMAVISPTTAARHGFNIFCYPFRSAIKPYHKAFLDTSEKFNMVVDDQKIQGYKWGHGQKKILFVHGWKSHSFRWKNYIQAFSEDEFTMYAIDAPGHGLSQGKLLNVPYYSMVLSKLINNIGAVDTVVAHSIGSFSMLHLLATQPFLPVKNLVVTAPPGKAADFFRLYKKELNLSPLTVELILEYFEKEINNPIDFFSTAGFASKINIPGLIIHDKDDAETPYHNAKAIHSAWHNSQLVTTEGLGHNLKSPKVIQMVKDFVTEQFMVERENG